MTTLIDSTVWIDYFRGMEGPKIDYLREAVRAGRVVVADLVLCEVLQGSRSDREADSLSRQFDAFPMVTLGGRELAVRSARNYRTLRSRGFTIRKTIDCLIATFCIEEGIELLHNDRDFDPFVQHLGLRVPSLT